MSGAGMSGMSGDGMSGSLEMECLEVRSPPDNIPVKRIVIYHIFLTKNYCINWVVDAPKITSVWQGEINCSSQRHE